MDPKVSILFITAPILGFSVGCCEGTRYGGHGHACTTAAAVLVCKHKMEFHVALQLP